MQMDEATQKEVERRTAAGCQNLTLGQMEYILSALGYILDRSLDCKSRARYLDTGESYSVITTGVKHRRTGLSFAHIDAPRDEQFDKLQRFRFSTPFVIVGDSLLEI